ncbi:MAG: hypothetical protein M3162_08525 [Thermoproteota archaeon]|nr:hypothetical protein [Thermoproteota archaeon]
MNKMSKPFTSEATSKATEEGEGGRRAKAITYTSDTQDTQDTEDTIITTINPENLEFKIYDHTKDRLDDLDFSQSDGGDPLLVKEFAKELSNYKGSNKSIKYNKTFIVKHNSQPIAFFTARLSVITCKEILDKDKDKVGEMDNVIAYPALLMEKIGIDKNYRCFGIGRYISLFCLGMAQRINEIIPCPFFVFKTTKSLAEKIYGPKYFFKWKSLGNRKTVWIYRRVV